MSTGGKTFKLSRAAISGGAEVVRAKLRSVLPGFYGELEHDALRYATGKVAAAGLSFATVPLLTNALGIEAYGRLSLLMVLALVVSQVTGGWLNQGVLRYRMSARADGSFENFALVAGRAAGWMALAGAGLVMMLAPSIGHADAAESAMLAGFVVFLVLYSFRITSEQADLRPGRVVAGEILRVGTPAAVFVAFASLGYRPPVVWVLCTFAVALVMARLVLRRGGSSSKSGVVSKDFPLARLVHYGAPLGAWFVLSSGQVLVGRLLLDVAGAPEELGLFSAFVDFSTKVGTLLLMPVTLAAHARVMASIADGSPEGAFAILGRASRQILVLGGGVTLMAWVSYPLIASLLFRGDPAQLESGGRGLFVTVFVAVMLASFALIAHKGLEIREQSATMAVFMAVALSVNVLVALVFLSSSALYGVTAGLLAGNATYVGLAAWSSVHRTRTAGAGG